MTLRRFSSNAAMALAAVLAAMPLSLPDAAQRDGPTMVFDSPRDNGYVSGATMIRVRFEPVRK